MDGQPASAAAAHARAVTVPHELMPDGLNVVFVESDGDAVVAVREGCPIEVALEEFNRELAHVSISGLWDQRWGGCPAQPPQQYRHAS